VAEVAAGGGAGGWSSAGCCAAALEQIKKEAQKAARTDTLRENIRLVTGKPRALCRNGNPQQRDLAETAMLTLSVMAYVPCKVLHS